MALKNDINEFINRGSQYLTGNKIIRTKNILAWMLEIQETKRISSIELALICQIDKLILSKIIMPYKKLFPPKY